MVEKKCPMCDGRCILKTIADDSGKVSEIDVCSLCGAKFSRGKDEKGREERD